MKTRTSFQDVLIAPDGDLQLLRNIVKRGDRMGTSASRVAQLMAPRALIDQSLQSIIGATETRRSSETADSVAEMPIFLGFSMLRVSARFLWISGRFGLAAVTKLGSKIACHNSRMRPMATVRARQRADGSVGYTAYIRNPLRTEGCPSRGEDLLKKGTGRKVGEGTGVRARRPFGIDSCTGGGHHLGEPGALGTSIISNMWRQLPNNSGCRAPIQQVGGC
jgi:hypothetical protein